MYGETMRELKVGDKIVLTNGDTGCVVCALADGYEYLMDRTGLYHHSYCDGSAVMGGPPVDVEKTEQLLAEVEYEMCAHIISERIKSMKATYRPYKDEELNVGDKVFVKRQGSLPLLDKGTIVSLTSNHCLVQVDMFKSWYLIRDIYFEN